MEEQKYLGRLEPGMDVCDVNGDKVGSISRVYRTDPAAARPRDAVAVATMRREDVLEVKTGLLGLGKHYYVPFDAILDVTSGCIFVKEPKDRIDELGWGVRPYYLDEMS
jgi:hypothetical protein